MPTNQSVYDEMCEIREKYQKGILVEVVRCKDCIHNYQNMIFCPEDYHDCAEFVELPITGDFYCARGERIDNSTDPVQE